MLNQEILTLLEAHGLQLASIQFSRNDHHIHVAVVNEKGRRFKGWAMYYKGQTPVNTALQSALNSCIFQFQRHGNKTEVK
jgi:hypothetical protein